MMYGKLLILRLKRYVVVQILIEVAASCSPAEPSTLLRLAAVSASARWPVVRPLVGVAVAARLVGLSLPAPLLPVSRAIKHGQRVVEVLEHDLR